MYINISYQDGFLILLGIFSIYISKYLFINYDKLYKLIPLYTFFICFFFWEWWWSLAPTFAPLCRNEIAMNYKTRELKCNTDINNITSPDILHAISNSFSDIFLMVFIFYIGISASPRAFNYPLIFLDAIKFIIIISICGVSQNMLLDSFDNFFPKFCCGPNKNEWCPISWSPLAPCQYCPNIDGKLITICYATEILWLITPNIMYFIIYLHINIMKIIIKIRKFHICII